MLINLEWLHLFDNNLSGPIPPELGNLANLQWLRLENNGLTGAVPAELGGLAKLRELRLDGNRLTGEIPPELGALSFLGELRLSGNNLSGCVPRTLLEIESNDLSEIGLAQCSAAASCSSGIAVADPAGQRIGGRDSEGVG